MEHAIQDNALVSAEAVDMCEKIFSLALRHQRQVAYNTRIYGKGRRPVVYVMFSASSPALIADVDTEGNRELHFTVMLTPKAGYRTHKDIMDELVALYAKIYNVFDEWERSV